jgi:UDP-N-acetylglucosamine transferase subunit ALG13
MEYHFDWRHRLVLSTVGGQIFEKAVKEGKLRGKVKDFSITISHEPMGRLLEFIENSKPEQVFTRLWTVRKIGKR